MACGSIFSDDMIAHIAHGAGMLCDEAGVGNRLVSVGNSPFWIVKAAEIVAKERQAPSSVVFMPFSGSFLSLDHHASRQKLCVYQERWLSRGMPNKGAVLWYRERLASMGLEPESMISRYKQLGQETVFVDILAGASTLASFLRVMADWAYEQGKQAMLDDMLAACKVVGFKYENVPGQLLSRASDREGRRDMVLRVSRYGADFRTTLLYDGMPQKIKAYLVGEDIYRTVARCYLVNTERSAKKYRVPYFEEPCANNEEIIATCDALRREIVFQEGRGHAAVRSPARVQGEQRLILKQ